MARSLALVVCVVVTMALAQYAAATNYQVGDGIWSLGNALEGGPNFYQNWARSHSPYHTTDSLEFRWGPGDSVAQVNHYDFQACDASHPLSFFDFQGSISFSLAPYRFSTVFFISGAPGNCAAGQKFSVDVLG